jgi:hypothetical protein
LLFAGLTFCLSGTLSQQKSVVEKIITAAGAVLSGLFHCRLLARSPKL